MKLKKRLDRRLEEAMSIFWVGSEASNRRSAIELHKSLGVATNAVKSGDYFSPLRLL